MANEGRIKPGIDKRESSLLFREIVPPHGWKEDENNHYLRLTLPGFQLIDVTLQIDKFGHLVVRGERQLSGHKFISFQETFDLPQNANVEESSGEFVDGEIYCVTIPKKQSSEYSKMKTPTQKSMGNPESKRDHANDSNKKSTRKPDEFHDPEVPKPDNTTNGSNTITTDHEKSTTNMWFLLVMLVIVLIVIVVPTSLRFRK
ncbi:SHSP domain-containing protein [Abeliophyllum distichum]|uniref:SHSP domain-containing protein n=1 Tax=Abeliophyllum distichum TaxID=126358 RepID=A0ABD1NSR8_9LAMI